MAFQPVAEAAGDAFLQFLDLWVAELDHFACVYVDEMIVMGALAVLEPGATIAEFEPLQDAGFFEQFDSAIDGRQRNARVKRQRAGVKLFDIRVIFGRLDHPRNGPALVCHAQTPGF